VLTVLSGDVQDKAIREGGRAMQSRAFSKLLVIGLLTVVYFIAGKFGLMLASLHPSASPVWPPAGIALAALLVLGYLACNYCRCISGEHCH
jgi:hypothetical protein